MNQDIHLQHLLLIVKFPLKKYKSAKIIPLNMSISHKIDSIFLIYSIWWSILILLTLSTLILSILCIKHCPNEYILPYILLGHGCFTLLIVLLLCYLRHGNDNRYINYFSIIILFIYFLSFILTTIFTFHRSQFITSTTYCLSVCYYISITFLIIQFLTIILQLPLVCCILILSAKKSNLSINELNTYV